MPVNTAGTYKLVGAILTVDVDGTPQTIECAATSLGVVAEPNYVSHPRTGCEAPYDDYVDSSYSMELGYAQGFGTDGIFDVLDALKGQSVVWQLQTGETASATFPVFTFTATVPALSPLPATEWGEFAVGDITIPIKGEPVKTITQPTAAAATAKAKAKT